MKLSQIDRLRQEILQQVWDLQDNFWLWTDKELAEDAGLSPSTVSRLRNNPHSDCRSSTLLKLVRSVLLEIHLQGSNSDVRRGIATMQRAA